MHNEINIPAVLAEITECFYRYEKALIENDVEILDKLFFENEQTIRYGVSEDLYGYKEIESFRKSRSAKGLNRTLKRTSITSYGENMAVTNTEFTRQGESRIGRQSQTWVKFSDGWKIVTAHVSLMK